MIRDILPPDVLEALKAGNKIEAIKIIREATGLAPGEVPRTGGPGKWLALLAVAAVAVIAAFYY
jgi:hypothetical protein